MSKRIEKKKKAAIALIAKSLPEVGQPARRSRRVSGKVLLKKDQLTVFEDGKEFDVDPDEIYQEDYEVLIPINHKRRLESAFKARGEEGTTAYLCWLKKHIVELAKTYPEYKALANELLGKPKDGRYLSVDGNYVIKHEIPENSTAEEREVFLPEKYEYYELYCIVNGEMKEVTPKATFETHKQWLKEDKLKKESIINVKHEVFKQD